MVPTLEAKDGMDLQTDAEWLETDGQGGFASGTVDTIRTRRYHALLLTTAHSQRLVLVNGIEAWVETTGGRWALGSQRYAPDAVWPDGARHIVQFTAKPWPTWRFVLPDGTEISQEVLVSRTSGETLLLWNADRAVRLSVRPLLSGRDYHALHHENPAFDFTTTRKHGGVAWTPYPGLPVITARGGFTWADDPVWYRRFLYTAERERGLDDQEDLASPGVFSWDLVPYAAAALVLRAGPGRTTHGATPDALTAEERKLRAGTADTPAWPDACYLARMGPRQMLLAGFPWFTAWGRDTFIAMRGLLLARGHLVLAADVLLAWADMVSEGMLPNRLPDGDGPPEYNAVDASLWFIVVVHELIAAGGASRVVAQKLRGAALAILQGYAAGTRFGIGMDPVDGLLRAGAPGVQLTWMDAKVDGRVITPRIGKPVEVQALWINALAIAGQWPGGDRWVGPAVRARDAFVAGFADRATGGLIDVLDVDGEPGRMDRSVRPNQVLAAGGLPIPVLTPMLARGVVALAERDLLTPLGLRTLSPADPAYRGCYTGGPVQRDEAYHQGTAWPWLLGPFVAAWLTARGNTPEVRAEGRARFLPPLHAHLQVAGLGHVSEVVDGDAPHRPGGCPFQAWSLGELIRIERMLQDPSGNVPMVEESG